MNLKPYFNVRFRTQLAGLEFLAETQCDDIQALTAVCRANDAHVAASDLSDIELVAAEVCFNLAREGGGCHTLDDESETLLVTVLRSLKVGAQHFFNERLGSYDRFNNRITPADLGMVFPDGTLRVVWTAEDAANDFDTTLEVLYGALGMLLELQDVPYGRQTEAELEDNDFTSLKARRIDALFAAGLWPAADDSFERIGADSVARVMNIYRTKPAPTPVAA